MGARREDRGLVDFVQRDAVIEVLHGVVDHCIDRDAFAEPLAGDRHERAQGGHVQRAAHAVVHDRQGVRRLRLLGALCGTLLGALLAVQHIGAGHVVFARTHERELDLILDIFDVEGAAGGLVADEGGGDAFRHPPYQLANPRLKTPCC